MPYIVTAESYDKHTGGPQRELVKIYLGNYDSYPQWTNHMLSAHWWKTKEDAWKAAAQHCGPWYYSPISHTIKLEEPPQAPAYNVFDELEATYEYIERLKEQLKPLAAIKLWNQGRYRTS